MEKYSLVDIIEYIDPRDLSYEEWLQVGMGLKEDGYSPDDWDRWSSKDVIRYHAGECYKKWETFRGEAGTKVTAGTIVQMAKDRGWQPDKGTALEWDAEIGSKDDLIVVEKEWLESKEVTEPKYWKPAEQLIKYIDTLFDSDEKRRVRNRIVGKGREVSSEKRIIRQDRRTAYRAARKMRKRYRCSARRLQGRRGGVDPF